MPTRTQAEHTHALVTNSLRDAEEAGGIAWSSCYYTSTHSPLGRTRTLRLFQRASENIMRSMRACDIIVCNPAQPAAHTGFPGGWRRLTLYWRTTICLLLAHSRMRSIPALPCVQYQLYHAFNTRSEGVRLWDHREVYNLTVWPHLDPSPPPTRFRPFTIRIKNRVNHEIEFTTPKDSPVIGARGSSVDVGQPPPQSTPGPRPRGPAARREEAGARPPATAKSSAARPPRALCPSVRTEHPRFPPDGQTQHPRLCSRALRPLEPRPMKALAPQPTLRLPKRPPRSRWPCPRAPCWAGPPLPRRRGPSSVADTGGCGGAGRAGTGTQQERSEAGKAWWSGARRAAEQPTASWGSCSVRVNTVE